MKLLQETRKETLLEYLRRVFKKTKEFNIRTDGYIQSGLNILGCVYSARTSMFTGDIEFYSEEIPQELVDALNNYEVLSGQELVVRLQDIVETLE